MLCDGLEILQALARKGFGRNTAYHFFHSDNPNAQT